MFGFLKNLLHKPPGAPAESRPAPAAQTTSTPGHHPAFSTAPQRRNLVHQNGMGIELPLQNILSGLPLELQPRVKQPNVGDLTISIPLAKILAQLSHGTVKISFGELRQAFPEVFTPENDRDRALVPLPLSDILVRLNPALIARRRVQRQVEVPSDVSSPFDTQGDSLIFSVGPSRPEAEPSPVPAPPRHTSPAPAAPVTPIRHTIPPAPATPPPAPKAPVAPPRFKLGAAPTPPPPAAPLPPIPLRPAAAAAPKPLPTAAPLPAAPALASAHPGLEPDSKRAPVTPAPRVTPAPVAQPVKPGGEAEPLVVALTALAEGWPEVVRKEIIGLNLVDGRVALSAAAVEQALKQGRIAFTWKTIRSWIKPAIPPAVSAHDGMVLELPLKVVAPVFLARQREASKTHQKVTIDEEIPNLFFGFPQSGDTVAKGPGPADTNYYVWDDSTDMVRAHESEMKRGPSLGTQFVAKYATPNEIVSRAAGLEGVAGALIALPDGLMVANQLSSDLNADTLAAFLPQIFGKVSQCTKELRMGELNNLNFTVGNIPWKIFRVNAIFFAAFGRVGEPLPTGQLAALAAELDHKPK